LRPVRASRWTLGVAAVAAVVGASPRSRSEVSDAGVQAPSDDLVQLDAQFRAEPDPQKRALLVGRMAWLPGAEQVLRRIVASDPSDDVALVAGNAWRRRVLADVAGVLRGRLDAADPARHDRLAREVERYQVFGEGQNLPRFLREAPPVFQVKTAGADRVRVLAFGDFGDRSPRQDRVAQAMQRAHQQKRFDLAITLGDNFYPAGVATPADDRWRDDFQRFYGPLRIPIFGTLGNHDWVLADSPAAEILHAGAGDGWRMPAMRYSFVADPVQFFELDTNLVTRAELDWLDAELGRSKARWKVVFGHHPIRSAGLYAAETGLREKLLPVLRGRANLYICGHEHDLEHLTTEDGVNLVVAGGGGAPTYPIKPSAGTLFTASANGFAVIEADHHTLTVSLIDGDLKVLHRFSIKPAE
jgi:tartrate-resistant acid phosphatase type 5